MVLANKKKQKKTTKWKQKKTTKNKEQQRQH